MAHAALREVLLRESQTASARRERAVSTFLVLHTAVTSAPSAFAICTAKVRRRRTRR
ncbi:MAG: hypothetical protein ACRDNY_06865 [Gaiellaceae bacterium]